MRFNSSSDNWQAKKSDLSDEEYKQLSDFLDDCELHLALFNSWEENFIIDMRERIDHKLPLTVKQREVIGNLHEKIIRRRK